MKRLLLEADRCLLCKNARCKANCPISTEIPEVVKLFKEDKLMEAGEILFKNNPLSAVCAVVCPHEDQCKGNCIRGIKGEPVSFCEIEELISNEYLKKIKLEKTAERNERIAIIGAGPAGITLALYFSKKALRLLYLMLMKKLAEY